MQPNDPLAPQPIQPLQPQQPPVVRKKPRTLALVLLIGPTVLFVLGIAIAITGPMLFPASPPADGEMFSKTPVGATIANMLAFLFGAIVVLTWLPGIIIGSILLLRK